MNIIKVNPDMTFKEQFARNMNNSIFLAGPCPRVDYSQDWRFEAFDILKELGFNGNVITPTNTNFHFQAVRFKDNDAALFNQTQWEYEAMKKSSAIVFWVDRHVEKGFPAFTTNIEFGDWHDKQGVYCGFPDDGERNSYLKARLKMKNIKYYNNLREMLKVVVDELNRQGKKFFTSDTHFSQQRTLEYSRRPFVNTYYMDMDLISNWNKAITMQDTVFHAGDFGDISTMEDYLTCLNYDTLYLILGNYDRKNRDELEKLIQRTGRKIVLVDNWEFEDDGRTYHIIHEPDEGTTIPEYPKNVVLYGHIHSLQNVKKNGISICSDSHNFTPISFDEVKWRVDALKYYDNNVFCKNAKI